MREGKRMADRRRAGPAMRLMQGAVIGTGAVLPGVSGGVLMVVFGVYQPVILRPVEQSRHKQHINRSKQREKIRRQNNQPVAVAGKLH